MVMWVVFAVALSGMFLTGTACAQASKKAQQ